MVQHICTGPQARQKSVIMSRFSKVQSSANKNNRHVPDHEWHIPKANVHTIPDTHKCKLRVHQPKPRPKVHI